MTINMKSIRSINLYCWGIHVFLVVIFALKNVGLVRIDEENCTGGSNHMIYYI